MENENEMKLTRISNDAANEQQIKHKSLAGLNKRPDLLQLRSFSMAQLQSKFRAAMLHAAFATCVRLQTEDCPPQWPLMIMSWRRSADLADLVPMTLCIMLN